MNRKQIIILVALGTFVLFEIVVFMLDSNSSSNGKFPGVGNGTDSGEVISNGGKGLPVFSPEVPKNAVETEPTLELPVRSDPTGQKKHGKYAITASRNGYEPSQLVVIQGDTISLTFSTDGGKYDFYIPSYGVYIAADKSKTESVSFKVTTAGTFLFECRDYCPKNKIQGQLIVKPAE